MVAAPGGQVRASRSPEGGALVSMVLPQDSSAAAELPPRQPASPARRADDRHQVSASHRFERGLLVPTPFANHDIRRPARGVVMVDEAAAVPQDEISPPTRSPWTRWCGAAAAGGTLLAVTVGSALVLAPATAVPRQAAGGGGI